jgi:16S rRNA (cytosine967-C5)-methyltransferase
LSTAVPLWRQLLAARDVLQAVRSGQSATVALERVAAPLRPAAQALAFDVLRGLARAEHLRRQLAPRKPPPAVDALLCVALALASRAQGQAYTPFTLVNQTVEAAKQDASTRPQAGFVNACLRRFLREHDALQARSDADPVARWNHPRWWIERLQRDHPQHWQSMLEADNRHPPMTLRVNLRHGSRDAFQARLREAGIAADPVGAQGLQLQRAIPVAAIPGFDAGDASVQDAAAQQAAPLLLGGLQPGAGRPRILDACAAPGGKTAHLLELCDAEVLALDIDAQRCERIRQTLGRLGLTAQVVVGDAAQPASWWDGRPFDAILLDAPCTASGIVRRHPDVAWLRRETDVAQLAATQAHLLRTLWPLLRPGGRLLYATCSVFAAEGRDPIETFLAHNTDACLQPSPGHLLPHLPSNDGGVPDNPQGDHDGFFYALLEKRRG